MTELTDKTKHRNCTNLDETAVGYNLLWIDNVN